MKNKLIIFFVILLQISWFNKTLPKACYDQRAKDEGLKKWVSEREKSYK